MRKHLLQSVRLALPWAIALGLFYYLFQKTPPDQVLRSLRLIPFRYFVACSVVYFLTLLVLDTSVLAKVLTRFDTPIRFRALLHGRCVTYLVSLINYNAGQAALAVYLKRRLGVSFFKTLGTIFFVAAIDLYWVILLAFLGTFFFTPSGSFLIGPWVRNLAYVAFAALALHLAFWRGWFGKVLPARFHFGLGDWLRGRHLFQAFHHATLVDYLRIAAARLPIHAMIIVSFWVMIRLAGAQIAFREIAAATPIILLFGAIPLTPGGLGAVQVATVELLKDRITLPPSLAVSIRPDELLLAVSLTWMALNYFIKAVSGLFCLACGQVSFRRSAQKKLAE